MTYREVVAVMRGRHIFLTHESNQLMRAAWHAAAFERMKRMPRLEMVLQKLDRRRVIQTPEEQARIAEQWLRANVRHGFVKVVNG